MTGKNQIPKRFQNVIKQELYLYNQQQPIKTVKGTPNTGNLSSGTQPSWHNISSVICVFIDMLVSTRLSSELRNKTFARAYLFYVQTALGLRQKGLSLNSVFFFHITRLVNMWYGLYEFVQDKLEEIGDGNRLRPDLETYDKQRIEAFLRGNN